LQKKLIIKGWFDAEALLERIKHPSSADQGFEEILINTEYSAKEPGSKKKCRPFLAVNDSNDEEEESEGEEGMVVQDPILSELYESEIFP